MSGTTAKKPAPVWAPPGSYNSPIVDPDDILGLGADATIEVSLPGIALDLNAQVQTLGQWIACAPGLWASLSRQVDRRYNPNNSMFGGASAQALSIALGGIKPSRYVEIGSGYTSAVMLDINDSLPEDKKVQCTFIDPCPERLKSLLRSQDYYSCTVVEKRLQDIDLGIFSELTSGDVLFIDSTHVLKSYSDVYREIFEVLPMVSPGVYIHFHDIFYPFDYPLSWMKAQNRSWNEAYFLRAFLMHNQCYEISVWFDYVNLLAHEQLRMLGLPNFCNLRISSIWLRKIESTR